MTFSKLLNGAAAANPMLVCPRAAAAMIGSVKMSGEPAAAEWWLSGVAAVAGKLATTLESLNARVRS